MNPPPQFSTAHIDYVQRNDYVPPAVAPHASMTDAPVMSRRLWWVRGVGETQRGALRERPANQRRSSYRSSRSHQRSAIDGAVGLPSEDVLVGLSGLRIPLAFVIQGVPSAVSVLAGTWSQRIRESAPPAVLNSRFQTVRALLSSLYPAIELAAAEDVRTPPYSLAGYAMGIPTIKPAESLGGMLPIDRLARAMQGCWWSVLILAEPVAPASTSNLRHAVINELRAAQSAAEAMRVPSPLAQHYGELLESLLATLSSGLAVGLWRTAAYLSGQEDSYYRLASVWQSIYSGESSLPEPVRVWELPSVPKWTETWGMPDVAGAGGPGLFQYPFACQTLLTSAQLAAYVHLPSIETGGFSLRLVPEYDLVPRDVASDAKLSLGRVVDRGRVTQTSYDLKLSDLSRHALVAGVTGSGKTSTLFHVLIQLWHSGVPFLVLEPAKTEYRSLLSHPKLGSDLQVFTLGEERVSPFRMNPFEVEPGVSVATHIDLLKSVFNASFGMWNPLPQVLERCLHAVYRDYGWDPVRGVNHRVKSGAPVTGDAFPTLTDLYQKIDDIAAKLGYEERITSDIRAGLMTRVNSLRIGGKGIMLDTQRSIPMKELLCKPTIIELEPIGDDDEKAFLMGLLLIRLYEHLRAAGSIEDKGLQHVVVVEEAHRLLANVPPTANQEQANVKGKAVETFANMLSEIRAYGEGFLIAEQIPGKLASDVVKNTNLKIVHRIVAGDDRQLIGEAMNMDEQQRGMLATLRVGLAAENHDSGERYAEAAVFAEGEDRAILVGVPYAKIAVPGGMRTKAGSDSMVADRMRTFQDRPEIARCRIPFEACPTACGEVYRYCELAHEIVELPEFQSQFSALVLAFVAPGGSPDFFARLLVGYVAGRLPYGTASDAVPCVAMNAARWYIAWYGRLYAWTYDTAEALRFLLIALLLKVLPPLAAPHGKTGDFNAEREAFAERYRASCTRTANSFTACGAVCPHSSCLFRFHAELLMKDRRLTELFDIGMANAAGSRWENLEAIEQAATRLVGPKAPDDVRRSAGLCYGIQQIAFKSGLLERAREMATDRLIDAWTIPGGRPQGGVT